MSEAAIPDSLIGRLIARYSEHFCAVRIDPPHPAFSRYVLRLQRSLERHTRYFARQGEHDPEKIVTTLESGLRWRSQAAGHLQLVKTGANLIGDLVLAQACVEREPRAIAEFRRRYEPVAFEYARRFAPTVAGRAFEDENPDLCRFFLETSDSPFAKRDRPKIDDFDGQTSLQHYFLLTLYGVRTARGTHSLRACRYSDWAKAAANQPRTVALSDAQLASLPAAPVAICDGCDRETPSECYRSAIPFVLSHFSEPGERNALIWKALHPQASQTLLACSSGCSDSEVTRSWQRVRTWLTQRVRPVRDNLCVELLLQGDADAWNLLREMLRNVAADDAERIDAWIDGADSPHREQP